MNIQQFMAEWPAMRDVKGGTIHPVGFGKIKVHSKTGRIGRVVGDIKSPRIMLKLRFANGLEETFSWGEVQPPTKEQIRAFELAEAKPLKTLVIPFARHAGPALSKI